MKSDLVIEKVRIIEGRARGHCLPWLLRIALFQALYPIAQP